MSTSLIHCIASKRKSEQELTWVLNLIFQHKNDDRVGFIKLKFRYLLSLLSSHGILWNFRWQKKIMVDGLLSDIGIVVVQFPRHLTRQIALYLPALEPHL